MAIKIGHASLDENKKIKNGQAGDQTGTEVCTRSWYSKPWSFVLRCIDSSKAELMAVSCEKGCNNKNIGYDQNQRNSLLTQAKKAGFDLSKIVTPCECDCSSFMTVCAESAGINIPYNGTNAPTTSTMKNAFVSTGMFEILTDSKYLTSDKYLKRGDILVKPGSHTVMALENGDDVSGNSTLNPSTNKICIDVSAYQGTINWTQVKANNIDYAIFRGVTKNGQLDTTFETNYTNALKAGINILGVYHFSYALNESTAISDAKNMICKLNAKKIPIYLDLEWSTQRALGKDKVTSIATAYVNTCKSLGYACHIYSNLDWFKNVYNSSALSALGCEFWIARYPSSDIGEIKESLKPNIGESIWQYSSKGKVLGINGNVDMNVVYKIPTNSADNSSNSETPIELMGKVITKSDNLNIRISPNSNSTKVGSYPKDKIISLIAKTSNGWYKTDKGYISGDYVAILVGEIFNCSKLNVRSIGKVEKTNIIGTLNVNDRVTLLKEENGWYKVKTTDNLVGYISGKYVKVL